MYCIGERCEVMYSNKMLCSLPHSMRIKYICTMVSIMMMKRIHDCFIIDLVMIDFALCGCTSMEFRTCCANFPDSNLRWKKPIDCRMNAIETMVGKRCGEMRHLKNNKYVVLSQHLNLSAVQNMQVEQYINLSPCLQLCNKMIKPDPTHEHLYLSCLHQPNRAPSDPA